MRWLMTLAMFETKVLRIIIGKPAVRSGAGGEKARSIEIHDQQALGIGMRPRWWCGEAEQVVMRIVVAESSAKRPYLPYREAASALRTSGNSSRLASATADRFGDAVWHREVLDCGSQPYNTARKRRAG